MYIPCIHVLIFLLKRSVRKLTAYKNNMPNSVFRELLASKTLRHARMNGSMICCCVATANKESNTRITLSHIPLTFTVNNYSRSILEIVVASILLESYMLWLFECKLSLSQTFPNSRTCDAVKLIVYIVVTKWR